jgi:DNA-binding NarL/FixJ family response regulator
MSRTTASHATTADAVPRVPVWIASGDAVTRRRAAAALAEDGWDAGDGLPGALPPEQPSALPTVALVLGVDLASTRGVIELREARSDMPSAAIVVVAPAGNEHDIRRGLRAGADGIVFDSDLETTLAVTLKAALAGLVTVPRQVRRQAVRPVFSHRERQILELVASGNTNREIADHLFLAESTVKCHLSSAFSKLGVRSRAEAAALVLDPEEPLLNGLSHLPDARWPEGANGGGMPHEPHANGSQMALGAVGFERGTT